MSNDGDPISEANRDRPQPLCHGFIRGKWNYQGVIITDDLVMGAIYQHDVCTAVVEALNAGVDLLLVAFDGAQFYRIFACASAAAGQARLDPAMLDSSDIMLNRRPSGGREVGSGADQACHRTRAELPCSGRA